MSKTESMTSKRLVARALVVALALVGVVGGAVALASAGDDEARVGHMRGAVAAVDARLGDAFEIFRSDRLRVADDGDAKHLNPFGQNTALSRAVPVARGSIYVIPGDDAVCLGDGINWGHTCVDVATAVDGGLFLITLGDPKTPYTTVSGLVPDGVSQVSVGLAGGKAVEVPVRDNVYDLELPGEAPPIVGIAWTGDAGGRHSVELPPGGVQRPSIAAAAGA